MALRKTSYQVGSYYDYVASANNLSSSELVKAKFYEVLHRFSLAVPRDKRLFFYHMVLTSGRMCNAWMKELTVEYSDEDALAVIDSYIYRLSPGGVVIPTSVHEILPLHSYLYDAIGHTRYIPPHSIYDTHNAPICLGHTRY